MRPVIAAGLVVFCAASAGPAAVRQNAVDFRLRLTPQATLASAPGLDCFKIETAVATFYLFGE